MCYCKAAVAQGAIQVAQRVNAAAAAAQADTCNLRQFI
jgi:hypothetical protein